jgi:BirA family biotin operon repressor/biotin-[acetyl-CoA-carboxylase] ligase
LSTEADALAWARSGAPEGAVVVADYQASPRGRAGWPWQVTEGQGLGFSVVLHPRLSPEREGWVYVVAACALADVIGDAATVAWPDEVRLEGRRAGAVGVQARLGPQSPSWAVVNVLVPEASRPRAPLLARLVEAIESGHRASPTTVLADYRARCETIGRTLRARLIPLGPGGPEVTGRAVTVLKDGALVLETADGRRVRVRPQNLGLLEDPVEAAGPPAHMPHGPSITCR